MENSSLDEVGEYIEVTISGHVVEDEQVLNRVLKKGKGKGKKGKKKKCMG